MNVIRYLIMIKIFNKNNQSDKYKIYHIKNKVILLKI